MYFHRFTTPSLAINSYLIADESSKKAVVIDPIRNPSQYIELARQKGWSITHILETHVHADFISGSKELKNALGGQPQIWCSATGGKEWIPSFADRKVLDGDEFEVGALTFKAIATPGHTPEHLSYLVMEKGEEIALFTGDFLFVGDVGRPDLLGEREKIKLAKELYHSVFNRLRDFPNDLKIYPAHGSGSLCGKAIGKEADSTLGQQWLSNPSLSFKPQEEWIENLMRDMPKAPPYFAKMKKENVEGAPLLKEREALKALSPEQIPHDAFILDVRSGEAFAKKCIKGSQNIPLAPSLSYWAGWLVPYDAPIVLVVEKEREAELAVYLLSLVGIDHVAGYLKGGVDAWKKETASYKILSPSEIGDYTLVDVRTKSEWEAGHLPQSVWIPLNELQAKKDTLNPSGKIALICQGGHRSQIGASYLLKMGFLNVSSVEGGMTGLLKSGVLGP